MLQKFALAFKSKTIEFFAEEDEDEDDDDDGEQVGNNVSISAAAELDASPEEVITGQRVVVLKPDPPTRPDPHARISSIFAAVSSFRASYLHLQVAHSPFDPEALRAADRAAVSHLHRLSELKTQNPNLSLSLSPYLEAQVKENQSLLRTFETVANRMQADIDRKDAEAVKLRQRLLEADVENDRLEQRLEKACSPPEQKVEALLSVGFFNSVLKDSCRVAHRFARMLIDLMKWSRWDLELVANSIYPGICYAKPGHCRYAILSYICLGMFEFFDSDCFGCQENGISSNSEDSKLRRGNSLRRFIEHSTLDPLELVNAAPDCEFARFCHTKYDHIISSGLQPYLLENSDHCTSTLGNLETSSHLLYELFVNMANSMWMLHHLAWAYDPVVEIFQIGQGVDFSMVYMESVCRNSSDKCLGCRNPRPKVGFTVVPGFRVGKTVIQCWVYLDGMKQTL